MKTYGEAKVSKSLDQSWVRWQVIKAGMDSQWFYSEAQAKAYADALNKNETAMAETIAKQYACQ